MAPHVWQPSQKIRLHGKKRKRAPPEECDENPSKDRRVASELLRNRPRADGGIDESIGKMNPSLLADYIAKKIKWSFRDLSIVELEDHYLPQNFFYDTTDFELPRISDNLPAFLERFSGGAENLSGSSTVPGSPHTLVIAASGLRAADVTRSLRRFQSHDSAVAKLFAKHIKLPEAVEYVKRTKIGIGIGTPQRLVDLLENGVMKTDNLKRLVIDASHLDLKRRSVFDMKELLDPLTKLLSKLNISGRLGSQENQARVIVF